MTRFARWMALLIALGAASAACAQTGAVQGHCYLGGQQALLSGMQSTNYQQGIVPACTVTVYLTGTQTLATIYADGSSTPLSNPFTANAVPSLDPGGWIFWAATNQGVDITLSGGGGNSSCTTAPNCYTSPLTLTDVYPSQSFSPVSGVTLISGVSPIKVNGGSGPATGSVTISCSSSGCGLPALPAGSLQFNSGGTFGGSDADWNSSLAFGFNFGDQSSMTTGWSCDGTDCTFTGPNTFLAGQYITISGSGVTCVNGAVAPVLSTGLSSAQFEILQSLTSCSGSTNGTNGTAQSLVGFMVNGGPTGIALDASTADSAGGSGGGSINLTASAMNSGTAYNSGDINLISYSNSLNTGNINLATNASGNTSGDMSFNTSGNSGGGLNFFFSGTCLTGGCGTHENAVGFNVTLTSPGSGPGVDDATTTFTETAPDGAGYFINLTTPAGGSGGGSLFKVTTNSANSGANNGAAIFSLVNTANPAQAAFSVTATGPSIFSSSNFALTLGGAMTLESVLSAGTTAVGSLPAAATWPGGILRVSDSTTVTAEGQTCVGGSTNEALAFSNGSVWKCF